MSAPKALRPMLPSLDKRNPLVGRESSKITGLNIVRDQLPLTSWLLLGAVFQSILVLIFPRFYSILPSILLFTYQVIDTLLMHLGVTRNRYMDNVIKGKFTAQIPSREGVFGSQPSDENVVCFMLIVRANHPLGIFSEGFKEISGLASEMFAELNKNPDQHGFLGSKSLLATDERDSKNHNIQLMYFRSLEDVHKFAHGPMHASAWKWWAAKGKNYGYLSIAHELYSSPKGAWENIYVDAELFGLPSTVTKVKKLNENGEPQGDWEYVHPVIDARRGKLAKQTGRVNREKINAHEADIEHEY